ncbi:TPA: hypothetical protein O7X39_004496 [Salmonella enterica]|nr:hypothetical protein [Salmonella enterica subsp. enterica serovar Kotte]HDC2125839.1 hypothetical protein [Salmonella enterica]
MAKYNVCTKVMSNVIADVLYYDMLIHKTDANGGVFILLSVQNQPLQPNYYTQLHETNETDDNLSVGYIVEVMLYRWVNGQLVKLFHSPIKRTYPLKSLINNPEYFKNKFQNICYFETKQETKSAKNGDINIYSLKVSCRERVFVSLEYPIGDPDDPFLEELIEEQIINRTGWTDDLPDQGQTPLCGPAAFFYCLIKDRNDLYGQVVRELRDYGYCKLGTIDISPGESCRHPKNFSTTKMLGIDWITLASLRDMENIAISYEHDGNSNKEGLAGITTADDVCDWFKAVGCTCSLNNTLMWTPGFMGIHSNIDDLLDLNQYAGNDKYNVVAVISASMLKNQSDGSRPTKDHWVVWRSKVTLANGGEIKKDTPLTEIVKVSVFSWGAIMDNSLESNITLGKFLSHLFGGVVFDKIK